MTTYVCKSPTGEVVLKEGEDGMTCAVWGRNGAAAKWRLYCLTGLYEDALAIQPTVPIWHAEDGFQQRPALNKDISSITGKLVPL